MSKRRYDATVTLALVGLLAVAGCAGPQPQESASGLSRSLEETESWMEVNSPGGSKRPAAVSAASEKATTGRVEVSREASPVVSASHREATESGRTTLVSGGDRGPSDRGRGARDRVLGGGPQEAGDVKSGRGVIDDLRNQSAINRGASRELVKQARKHRTLGELPEAERRLVESLGLWPANEDAQQLLDEVRLLLGDRRGEVPVVSRDITRQERVKVQLLRFEIERHLNRAAHQFDDEDYGRAIDSYKRAIDGINQTPFDIGIDSYLKRAKKGLADSEAAKKKKEFEDRQQLLRIIQQQKQREEATTVEFVENHIRSLRRRAASAVESKDFDKASSLFAEILVLNPSDMDALTQRRLAKDRHHLQQMDRFMRSSVENFRKAVLAVEESSVIYQEIFRYPDKDVWMRITPKVTDIRDQLAEFESPVEKAIRARLSQPITYGLEEAVPLRDALKDLQSLTGVNFFIQDADLGDTDVQLETLTNLPLRNVLAFLLKKAGEEVGYVIREGAVLVAADAEQLEEPRYLRFYEISDLTTKHPDFPAPDLALDELQGKDSSDVAADIALGDDDDDDFGGAAYDGEELLMLIGRELNQLGGGDEDAGDDPPEGIRIQNGKLMALTTLENHIHLATMLERFRKALGMMVTIESRFLDVQDNFLEQIGIDFGSGNTTFLPNTIPDIDGEGTQVAPGYEFIDARGDFNLRASTIGALSNPIGSQVNPFNFSASGGGAYQINVLDAERFQLEALLTGVTKEQEVRHLNSPRVTAFNTQTAHTLVVRQAAYIQDLEVNQTGVIPVINPVIGVLNTGSILEVRPTISYDRKFVVLEIQPTLAEQIGQDVAILNLSNAFTVVPVQLPVISVTKIKTTVNVPDGGTVLLGGLKREVKTAASIGLPIFRQIPIMNLFFGRVGNSSLRSNLFVLINATVTVVHEEEANLFGTGI